MTRSILMPTDFSDVSVKMLDFACKHLLKEYDTVFVYHAIPETNAVLPDIAGRSSHVPLDVGFMRHERMSRVDVEMFPAAVNSPTKEEETSVQNRLLAEARKCGEQWKASINSFHESIDVRIIIELSGNEGSGPMIIKAIKQIHPDIVVVGTHGKSSLRTLIMGSVSTYVLAHCKDIPVLTISNHH